MTTPLLFPDAERATVVLLADLTGWAAPPTGDNPPPTTATTAGVGVPGSWNPAWAGHVQIAQDGAEVTPERLVEYPLIRITAWAATTTEAKALAREAEARLCAHGGGGGISKIRPATGIIPARDPDTGGELATFAVRLTVRSTPLT